MKNYLIRLDDACPYMDREKWQRMEELLDRYSIKPLVGIIPANRKPDLFISPEDSSFWSKVQIWIDKGWSIALHGYDHVYISNSGGVNPFWQRSEFAGVSLEKQKEKIKMGVTILRNHGINPYYFFAPSHTFDENTLQALRDESDIRIISDTIGRYPYRYRDFLIIPQITGHCVKISLSGIYTFCFHPNILNDVSFAALESFLKQNHSLFISFDDIDLSKYGKKKVADRLLSWIFFTYRKMRGLK